MMGFLFNVLMVSLVSVSKHTLAMAGSYNGNGNYVYDRLMDKVLTGYNKEVRPRCDNGSAVVVHIDMSLRQVTELNEHTETLKANIWIRMNWTDCRLSWNSSEFDGMDRIVLPSSSIWIPYITLYESAADETMKNMRKHMAAITEAGFVDFRFPEVLTSLCQINTKSFPFDKQNCELSFGSWAFSQEDLIMSRVHEFGSLTDFKENVGWTVSEVPASKSVKLYLGIPYEAVTFSIQLKRKSLFYGFSLIFPWVLMSTIATFAFLLPPDKESKLELQATVLLSLTVFQLILVDLMPAPSDSYPLLGMYFTCSMILVAASLIVSIISDLRLKNKQCAPKEITTTQKEDEEANESKKQGKDNRGLTDDQNPENIVVTPPESNPTDTSAPENTPETEGKMEKCKRKLKELSCNHIFFIVYLCASVLLLIIFVCVLCI